MAPWIHDIEVGGETLRTRNVGIARNRQLIERCDELWLVGDVISPGMQQEKEHAEALGVEIVTCIGSVYPDDSLCVEDENDPVIPFW